MMTGIGLWLVLTHAAASEFLRASEEADFTRQRRQVLGEGNSSGTTTNSTFDDDDIGPCSFYLQTSTCNVSADCQFPSCSSIPGGIFCELRESGGHCTECEACRYDTDTPTPEEGRCDQGIVCNITDPVTTYAPRTTISRHLADATTGESNGSSDSSDDQLSTILVPVLGAVIVLSILGTLYFCRKIHYGGGEALTQLLYDDTDDVIVSTQRSEDGEPSQYAALPSPYHHGSEEDVVFTRREPHQYISETSFTEGESMNAMGGIGFITEESSSI